MSSKFGPPPEPPTQQEVEQFMDGLVFSDEPLPEDQVPPPLREGETVNVATSIRWPWQMDVAMRTAAEAQGVSKSELMRQFAEEGLRRLSGERIVVTIVLNELGGVVETNVAPAEHSDAA